MGFPRAAATAGLVGLTVLMLCVPVWAGEVWINCHITCRCLHDDSVGNFNFVLPVDITPDTGFDADWACGVYGNRVCADGCNGTKFTYTYQVVSP